MTVLDTAPTNGRAAEPALPLGAISIIERLRGLLIREETFQYTPDLPDDASLIEAGAIDSFGMIALVIHIEEAFGIKVLPEDATVDRFQSVSSIAAYVEGKLDGHHRR